MRFFLLSIIGLISGCASSHTKIPQAFVPPSVSGVAAPVQRARSEVSTAVADLHRLAPHVDLTGQSQLQALRETLAAASSASEEAQQGLLTYATQVDAQTKALNVAQAERNHAVAKATEWRSQAHDNARERDVVLILFAMVAAVWIGTMFAGEILRNFPAPWSFVGAGLLYLGIGIGSYTLGRFVLHAASRLIP
jgi:hypothetical protein